MKHLILVIAILAGAASAQAQQSTNCLELKKIKLAGHTLHQQGSTQATLILKVKNCEIIEDHRQTAVAFESRPGLDVTLDDIAFHRPENPGEGANRVEEIAVVLTLTASPELPLGESTLRGVLTYQAVRNGAAVAPQGQAIAIPLKVAPPKPPKQKNEFVEGLKSTGEFVAGIALLPVFLVITLVYCPISGECPNC
jgi:hypothetical protein